MVNLYNERDYCNYRRKKYQQALYYRIKYRKRLKVMSKQAIINIDCPIDIRWRVEEDGQY